MSRYTCTTLALGAALALSGAAYGQTLNAGTAQPQTVAGDPVASTVSILRVVEATQFDDGTMTSITIIGLDALGDPIDPLFDIDVSAATEVNGAANTDFTAGVDVVTVDLGNIAALNNALLTFPGTAGLRLRIEDINNNVDTVDFELASADAPSLETAFVDTANDVIFLVFNRSLNNGSADNNDNQTVLADLSGTFDDFEMADDAAFTTNVVTLDGTILSNPAIIGPLGNVIRYDIDPGSVTTANFVRYAGSDEVKSITGTDADTNVVQFSTEPTLSVVSAEWLATIANGGNTADSLRVTFNQPLGAAGNVDFFRSNGGDATWTVDGANISVNVLAAALDPDNSDSVLLHVSMPGGQQVNPDGLNADDFPFIITMTESAGANPETVLGTEFSGSSSALTISDAIVPTRTGGLAFLDTTGDGVANAVAVEYNEPIVAPNAGATQLAAVEFNTINTTVHPISVFEANLALGITNPTDAANQVEIATDSADSFNATGFDTYGDDDEWLVVEFDVDAIDFVGDGSGIGNPDLYPGGFDAGWANIAINAANLGVQDLAGNTATGNLAATTINFERIAPVFVAAWFQDGENLSGGLQSFRQTTGTIGGAKNNDRALLIFNEALSNAGIAGNANSYSWGPGANDRFAAGNFSAVSNNIVTFIDSNSRGFLPGLTLSIAFNNGIEDDNLGIPFGGGSQDVVDNTAPYVPLQRDINGATVYGAFVDDDGNGFVESITLRFTKDVDFVDENGDSVAPEASDFEIDGVDAADITVDGNVIVLTPESSTLSATSNYSIFHTGGTASRRLVEAGVPANRVLTSQTLTASPLALPDVFGEWTAVMDVWGEISRNGEPMPTGTKVFGMLGVQVVDSITITQNNVTSTIVRDTNNGWSSLEAFTNFLLGIKPALYLFDDDNDVWFSNDRDDDDGDLAIYSVQARVNRGAVTWQARGFTYTQGDSPQQSLQARGSATLVWDVLRSDGGTVADLVQDGFELEEDPIMSRTVVAGTDGSYLLHMTGPSGALGNAQLSLRGAPIIIVVETPEGDRFYATTIHNAADGFGTLQFFPLQGEESPVEARANGNLDIDLDNIGTQIAYGRGWNLIGFDRDSGFAAGTRDLPQVSQNITPFATSGPAADANTILAGTAFDNAPAILQFGFFRDGNNDGKWSAADGDLQNLIIDPRGRRDAWFTMNDRGVFANAGVGALVGGYGFGYFNGRSVDLGIQQFGAPMGMDPTFASPGFRSSRSNLGWALITAPADFADPDAFLASEGADFLIEFNRTSDGVVISTFDGTGAGSGDTTRIRRGQAYFVHYSSN